MLPDPASVIMRALDAVPLKDRADYCRKLMCHSAAGLMVYAGGEKAAEHAYRLADAIVNESVERAMP